MPSTPLSAIRQFRIAQPLVDDTLRAMQRLGDKGLECLVLWLGKVDGECAVILKAFTPKQQSVSSENGVGYFVSSQTLFELNRDLATSGLRLVAQVHSHPGEAYHSEADDRYAIVTAEGGLSLVVPDFGYADANPASWAIYRLMDGAWKEVSPVAAAKLIEVEMP